jgi:hypothetical protein
MINFAHGIVKRRAKIKIGRFLRSPRKAIVDFGGLIYFFGIEEKADRSELT